MNGIHDMGGMHGFGRVPYERDPELFRNETERRSFALTNLALAHISNVDKFRHAIERLPIKVYLSGYYERWLAATESLLDGAKLVTSEEVQARAEQLAAGQKMVPASATRLKERLRPRGEGSTLRPIDRPPRFAPGDAVVTRNLHPSGHTRLPRYARGKTGTVVEAYPSFVFPDTNANDVSESAQYVFAVSFEAIELWGDDAEPNVRVNLDLFEDYLTLV